MRDPVKVGRRVANRLPLPDPWRVESLCEQVAEHLRRPIHLLNRPALGDSITATVLTTRRADYVFVRDDLVGLHRDHAICHELGHILAGHTEQPTLTGQLSVMAPESMQLTRDCQYGELREMVAETIADTIMQRVSQRSNASSQHTGRAQIVRGFGDALQ